MMQAQLTRRVLITSSAGLAAAAIAARVAEAAPTQSSTVSFTVEARVLDGGERVAAIHLSTRSLGRVDPNSVTTATFGVHALAVAPVEEPVTFLDGELEVTGVRTSKGGITLDLAHGEGIGCPTLGYLPGIGNVMLQLTFTITQRAPFRLRRSDTVVENLNFQQGKLVDAEVDRYRYATAASGMQYRLFRAHKHKKGTRPLIVWLHGAGEGARPEGLPMNETHLRANRGALGFSTDEAQKIFKGAYVLAPQAPTEWGQQEYASAVLELIEEVVSCYRIDRSRIHVAGNSAGGYMALNMAQAYPDYFASCLSVCPPIHGLDEAAFARVANTPTWYITAATDTALPPEEHAVAAHQKTPGSILTLYPNVVWEGNEYPGHWSWIYVAHNDPTHDGVRLWNWMAQQARAQ